MTDLQLVRGLWIKDRPSYQRFVEFLEEDIRQHIKKAGIYADVYGRAKELDSLLKKLLAKKVLSYETLRDKAGVRIVVRFPSEINLVRKAIEGAYHVTHIDDKTAALQVDQFGYQGLHLEIKLRPSADCQTEFAAYEAELQVKTKAQNLWSELNHELAYKTNVELPSDIRRRLFNLAALLETADRDFESVNREISSLAEAGSLRVLAAVEKQFYKINPTAYSRELSISVIEALKPLYSISDTLFVNHFENFYNQHSKKLEIVFRESTGRSLFLSQPEVLMVFDLLDKDEYALKDYWPKYFPAGELEELAHIWGKPLD